MAHHSQDVALTASTFFPRKKRVTVQAQYPNLLGTNAPRNGPAGHGFSGLLSTKANAGFSPNVCAQLIAGKRLSPQMSEAERGKRRQTSTAFGRPHTSRGSDGATSGVSSWSYGLRAA